MNARRFTCAIAFGVALFAVGCGGAASGGAPPKSSGEETVDTTKTTTTTTTTTSAVPEEKEITTPEQAQKQIDDSQQAFDAASGDCAQMCKALSSMQRAVDHLCNLASDDDEKKKCDDARARVSNAEAKVKATCGGCG